MKINIMITGAPRTLLDRAAEWAVREPSEQSDVFLHTVLTESRPLSLDEFEALLTGAVESSRTYQSELV